MKIPTNKYRYCNHHHELTDDYEIVDYGDGEFIANKQAVPLLKALNEAGLRTRSHHIAYEEWAWVCILLDNVSVEILDVYEEDAERTKYNGKKEMRITWKRPEAANEAKEGKICVNTATTQKTAT
jgi:hypothetical protein